MRPVVLLLAGCNVTGAYVCTSSTQCTLPGKTGYCEATGACSFDDTTCPTQRRYDDSAGTLANRCVTGIVTGRYVQRYADNDASYLPAVHEEPATAPVLTVRAADGSMPAVSYDAGAFAFPGEDGAAYELSGVGATYQLALPHVEIGDTTIGRPDRTPVTRQTPIKFAYTNNPQGQAVIVSTGLWTHTETGNNNSQLTVDWSTAISLSGPSGLLDASRHDRLYFTKVNTTNGVSAIVAVDALSLTLTDGGITNLPFAALPTTPADQCRHLVVPAAQQATKLGGGSPSWDWAIEALPAPAQLGAVGALPLASINAGTTPVDLSADEMFTDPFPGTSVVVHMDVSAAVPISAPGAAAPSPQTNETSVYVDAGSANGCATMVSTLPQLDVPGDPAIDGVLVAADATMVAIDRAQPVTIAWPAADADWHELELFQLGTDACGNTTVTGSYDVRAIAPSVTLDPESLPSGTYVLRLTARLGWPGASHGDFTTRQLPFETVSRWTHSFMVP